MSNEDEAYCRHLAGCPEDVIALGAAGEDARRTAAEDGGATVKGSV
jgi:hypothetical protein